MKGSLRRLRARRLEKALYVERWVVDQEYDPLGNLSASVSSGSTALRVTTPPLLALPHRGSKIYIEPYSVNVEMCTVVSATRESPVEVLVGVIRGTDPQYLVRAHLAGSEVVLADPDPSLAPEMSDPQA